MKQHYITILDFTNGTVDQYNLLDYYSSKQLSTWGTEDFEEFLINEGYMLSNIEWMSHYDDINYPIHKIYKR